MTFNSDESEVWLGARDKAIIQGDFMRIDLASGNMVFSADYDNIGDVYSIIGSDDDLFFYFAGVLSAGSYSG